MFLFLETSNPLNMALLSIKGYFHLKQMVEIKGCILKKMKLNWVIIYLKTIFCVPIYINRLVVIQLTSVAVIFKELFNNQG